MSRLTKSVVLGLIIAVIGLGIGILPFGVRFEERTGLALLFRLRGVRTPPPDVVVIGIDKRSSDALGLVNDPRKWPRSLHAELVDRLTAAGAAGIVFDMFFEEPRPGSEDAAFAAAVRRAGNVILCRRLQTDRTRTTDGMDLYTEKMVSPVASLEDAAFALAPFPMPKMPLAVIRSWAFKASAGDAPTLPVVAFQLFSLDRYDDLIRLMREAGAALPPDLPADRARMLQERSLVQAIQSIRSIFDTAPGLAEKVSAALEREFPGDGAKARTLRSLVAMYAGDTRRYLNFYGPPGTITTIPYDLALGRSGLPASGELPVKGRMVFVGFSELFQPEQKDSFYSVFSRGEGGDVSGLELAATGFANLLEDLPVRPLGFSSYAVLIILWGILVGMTCRMLPGLMSAVFAACAGLLYLLFAYFRFSSAGVWFPVAVPVFVQPALAFVGAMIWKYADANREKRNIRDAFGYYLPADVVDRLARDMSNVRNESRSVYGVCLYTDAEGYTSLAETMDSSTLGDRMNRYYESVFRPIKEQGGSVSNVVGDSVLALWLGPERDSDLLSRACSAALQIDAAMRPSAAEADGQPRLRTRIGLHAGQIMLGNLGAMDHFEYRPVGDIVNTTTRLDGLNKKLGTRILVSESVAAQLGGFLLRDVGTFLLAGKIKPIRVYELVCRQADVTDDTTALLDAFSGALAYFRQGRWEEAGKSFSDCSIMSGKDGPSLFYLDMCRQYQIDPPAGVWDGVIRMDKK